MTALAETLRTLDGLAPGSVRDHPVHVLAMAHDASHYLMTPAGVVTVRDQQHLSELLRLTAVSNVPVSFRSGGTSLSGQASTEALLLDTRRSFRAIEVLDEGKRVRVQPGATVRQVNTRLARYGRQLGPDPASEIACTLGGVIANNSSGMSCGTVFNTYNTIESAVLVLVNGSILDTSRADADDALKQSSRELWQGLIDLRDQVRANPDLVAEIKRQFAIKNTMGYAINAFLDYDSPAQILLHLVVGSEGTLAFVAQATLRTLPVNPHAATGMLYFSNLTDATGALPALVESGAAAIELLDSTSLRVAQRDAGAGPELAELVVDQHAALLIEYKEPTEQALSDRIDRWHELEKTLPVIHPVGLSTDPVRRAQLWHIRKDLYATIAGARPSGTTALLEDVAVPVTALRDTCERLTDLFTQHGYGDSVIFGHAKDGNLHFMITERFDADDSVQRYSAFTEDMVSLILSHGGTLKAEHGTGRIMAPYVRRQYGDELYEVMVRVKQLADPTGRLNPGVLMNESLEESLQHMKTSPTIESEADRCVECGYCEPVCPSKDLTLTPRQRIVLRRERERALHAGDSALVSALDQDYGYEGVDTCAADGMCVTACPVGIDTGVLVKRLRSERDRTLVDQGWQVAARNWEAVTRVGSAALTVAKHLPPSLVGAASDAGRALLGKDAVPHYDSSLPAGGTKRRPAKSTAPVAVYVPSCIGAMFAPAGDGPGVHESFLALCERAGVSVLIPEGIGGMCCGTPRTSKGNARGRVSMSERTLPILQSATNDGELPIICDGVSCTEGYQRMAAGTSLTIIDAVTFVEQAVRPRLRVHTPLSSLVIYPTCSSTHLGVTDPMVSLGHFISDSVIVPDAWGCCGFAGDRGMLHPELTASATHAEAQEVMSVNAEAYASANRTCELGMQRATGREYRHILELVAEATDPGNG